MRNTLIKIGLLSMMVTMMVIPKETVSAAEMQQKTSELVCIDNIDTKTALKSVGLSENMVISSIGETQDVQVLGLFTTKYIVTANVLNIRSGPGTGYAVVGSLFKNDIVKVKSISEGWAKFKYDGQWRYVSATYLKKK